MELNEALVVLKDWVKSVNKMKRDIYGCQDCEHVRDYHGKEKIIFPNDLGFRPDTIKYKIANEIYSAEVALTGEIIGPFIKSGKWGKRASGENYGEIVLLKKFDKNSKIIFEKNRGGLKDEIFSVKRDIERIKSAASSFVIGEND